MAAREAHRLDSCGTLERELTTASAHYHVPRTVKRAQDMRDRRECRAGRGDSVRVEKQEP